MLLGDLPRCVQHQGFGLGVTDDARGCVQAFTEQRWTMLQVVRVAGEDGHYALLQQVMGDFFCRGAEAASHQPSSRNGLSLDGVRMMPLLRSG